MVAAAPRWPRRGLGGSRSRWVRWSTGCFRVDDPDDEGLRGGEALDLERGPVEGELWGDPGVSLPAGLPLDSCGVLDGVDQ